MFFSPLEQFEYNCFLCVYNSKVVFFLYFLCILFFFISFFWVQKNMQNRKGFCGHILKFFLLFMIKISREGTSTKHTYFFPNLSFLFFFIFMSNLVGMIPYSTTVTSLFVITFFLSFQQFVALFFFGCLEHGFKIFGLFLPAGVPIAIAPFLVVIELISFIARIFSLAIRLFANIMAGHSLLKILAGFVWTICNSNFFLFALFPAIVVFLVCILEVLIAFLQAYVFTLLVAIYWHDVVFVSH